MQNYAANTEEAILVDYFASVPSGFFVEVGGYHPFDLSVSWPFERQGWTGIMIEPIPEYAERLREIDLPQFLSVRALLLMHQILRA
jgi:hypothetical protein